MDSTGSGEEIMKRISRRSRRQFSLWGRWLHYLENRRSPWRLLEKGEYEKALAGYDQMRLDQSGGSAFEMFNRGTALMCLGRYEEALVDYQRAALTPQGKPVALTGYEPRIAMILWMCGRREEAADSLSKVVTAVRRAENEYGDGEGDAGPALLLWYVSVARSDGAGIEQAMEYLRWLPKNLGSRRWPVELAEVMQGQRSPDELPKLITGRATWEKAIKVARRKRNYLIRRRLCKAIFYVAVLERSHGREAEAQIFFRQAADLDVLIEIEWYLARAEVRQKD